MKAAAALAEHEDASGPAPAVSPGVQDRDATCPALAGSGWLAGDCLTLRLRHGELAVRAPRRLLQRALKACDGRSTWAELVLATTRPRREEFSAFLEFLFEQGALVHADTRPDVPKHRRAPSCTFSGAALSLRQLLALVSCAAGGSGHGLPDPEGLVQQRAPASADEPHSVQWLVVLQQPVGGLAPGVHAAEMTASRRVALRLRTPDISWLPRAFTRPWELRFATGVLLAVAAAPAASLRQDDRTLRQLLLETGAALQDVARAAGRQGLASCIVHHHCEETLLRLCGLQGQAILAAALFGGAASAGQRRLLRRVPPVRFAWADAEDAPGSPHLFVGCARSEGGVEVSAWGRDRDPWMAYVKAHAEIVERQALRAPREVQVAPWRDLPDAVRPTEICAYAPGQYRQAGFPFARFDPAAPMHWLAGQDAATGRRVHVPADFACRREALPVVPEAPPPCLHVNSSGCAAGVSLEEALHRALYEVIERDAFMAHWLAQRPGRGVPARLLPASVAERVHRLQAAGCEVRVQSLDAAVACACLVSATHVRRHFTCVAASARFDFAEATQGALDELETMVATRLCAPAMKAPSPREVRSPGDHTLLYAQRRHFRAADAILHPDTELDHLPPAQRQDRLGRLLDALIRRGLRPLFVDITPARNRIDDGRTALTVVKAIVPSLIPISFGHGREPRAMVARCDPRSRFPHPFP